MRSMAITNLVHSYEADVPNCPHPQPDGDHITPHIDLKHPQQHQLNGTKKHVHWEDLEYASVVGEQGSALPSKNSPAIVSDALDEDTVIKLELTPNPASTVDQANIDCDDKEGSVVKKEKKPCPPGPSRPMTRSVTTGLRSQTGGAANAELPKRVGKHNPCFRWASIPVICEPEGGRSKRCKRCVVLRVKCSTNDVGGRTVRKRQARPKREDTIVRRSRSPSARPSKGYQGHSDLVSISRALQEGFSIVDMRLKDLSKAVKEVVGKLDVRRPEEK